jgi:hypothetical protein
MRFSFWIVPGFMLAAVACGTERADQGTSDDGGAAGSDGGAPDPGEGGSSGDGGSSGAAGTEERGGTGGAPSGGTSGEAGATARGGMSGSGGDPGGGVSGQGGAAGAAGAGPDPQPGVYRASAMPSGTSFIIIEKRDDARDLCFSASLTNFDQPNSFPNFSRPSGWYLAGAHYERCSGGTPNPIDDVFGSIVFGASGPNGFPCDIDLDFTIVFDGLATPEVFRVDDLPVEGAGC